MKTRRIYDCCNCLMLTLIFVSSFACSSNHRSEKEKNLADSLSVDTLLVDALSNTCEVDSLQIQKEVLASTDSLNIIRKITYDKSDNTCEVSLWIGNKYNEEDEYKLYTVYEDAEKSFPWCGVSDGKAFIECPIDSIASSDRVYIYKYSPLQILVESNFNLRNDIAFFIDVPKRKAWYIPANSGYLGQTVEGYMLFWSYRYMSDPDILGRYTFLQVFNDKGILIDSLNLEHLALEEYQNLKD